MLGKGDRKIALPSDDESTLRKIVDRNASPANSQILNIRAMDSLNSWLLWVQTKKPGLKERTAFYRSYSSFSKIKINNK